MPIYDHEGKANLLADMQLFLMPPLFQTQLDPPSKTKQGTSVRRSRQNQQGNVPVAK